METKKEGMTRRDFLKRNIIVAASLALLSLPLKSFADIFRRQPRKPNVSDKEARYYRTSSFIRNNKIHPLVPSFNGIRKDYPLGLG